MKKVNLFVVAGFLLSCSALFSQKTFKGLEAEQYVPGAEQVVLNTTSNALQFAVMKNGSYIEEAGHLNWLKKNVLKLNADYELTLYKTEKDELGYTHYRYKESYKGTKVEYGVYYVHVKAGRVVSVNGEIYSTISQNLSSVTPKIDKNIALAQAKTLFPSKALKDHSEKHKGLTILYRKNVPYLCYHFELSQEKPLKHSEIFVDAQSNKIILELNDLANKFKDLPMLARTHGQSASPTTFGKEMKVFAVRLEKQLSTLSSLKIEAKLNGATGNYNAHIAAYPEIDWPKFTQDFISGLNLEPNLITTQIETHDSYVTVFDNLKRINTVLLDFNQDIWRYISDGWVGQIPKAGETGSSTMPHKINPIDFENSEGNLGLANALFEFFARKLPISRLQRDLSDSTVERAFGTAFGHSYLAYVSLEKGLSKIRVNEEKIKEDLLAHPEVIAEAIQTVLRRENFPVPYEALKELTRGKQITTEDFDKFIIGLEVSNEVKKELKNFTPESYTGLASDLASK